MALGIPALYQGFQVAATSIMTTIVFFQTLNQEKRVFALMNKEGDVVLEWDSCISFEFHNESTISDAPQEQGAFISYNKVQMPFLISTSGTKMNADARPRFIQQALNLLDDLTLYDFVTPDRVYRDVNVTSINQARNARNGYSIAVIDFNLKEVRLNLSTRTEETAEPSGAAKKSWGQVQQVEGTF